MAWYGATCLTCVDERRAELGSPSSCRSVKPRLRHRRTDRDLAEAALAHALDSKTEAAYQRSKFLEQRRELMQAWADFATGK